MVTPGCLGECGGWDRYSTGFFLSGWSEEKHELAT